MKKDKVEIFPVEIDINFVHKNSEVSYDPTNKFYQVTFLYEFEKEVFDFINSFVNLVFSQYGFKDFGALPADKNMVDFFFLTFSEFNDLNWQKYSEWYYNNKSKMHLKLRNIILNAIENQKKTKIQDFEFFTWLSIVTLFSSIIEEYFFKHFEKFSILKDTLHFLLGKIFEIILIEIYEDKEIDKIRIEKLGSEKSKIKPLINRYVIIYNDIADFASIEKIIFSKDKAIFIDRTILTKFLQIFENIVQNSNKVKLHGNLKNILSNTNYIKLMLSFKKEKKLFLKSIDKEKEFKERLIVKYEKSIVLNMLKDIIRDIGSNELLNFIKQEEAIEDMFFDVKLRSYLAKIIKPFETKKTKKLLGYINDATERISRSHNRFFNTVSGKELGKIITTTLENFSYYLTITNNFHTIRQKYGKRTAYSDEMFGVKLLRQSVIKSYVENAKEILDCQMITNDKKVRIENIFQEGSLFYIREDGLMYPGEEEKQGKKRFFLFADLRNFTETTMKLTKDTASFLTPYLNSVYRISKEHNGNEIYFAGDGYAAHFSKITDAIRASYFIQAEFNKLRKQADEKVKEKEKKIYLDLIKLGIINSNKQILNLKIDERYLSEDIKEVLHFINLDKKENIEEIIKKIAQEYSMPIVEIGIAITEGELFIAVIGEENIKFNIVLSPNLNQAARLSGSSPEVKEYVDKLYGMKNLPKKVFSHKKKLFNQGIVITQEVYNSLRNEVEIFFVDKEKIGFSFDIYYYFDRVLEKYITFTKVEEPVNLKGINYDIEIFEIFSPATQVGPFIENWIANSKK